MDEILLTCSRLMAHHIPQSIKHPIQKKLQPGLYVLLTFQKGEYFLNTEMLYLQDWSYQQTDLERNKGASGKCSNELREDLALRAAVQLLLASRDGGGVFRRDTSKDQGCERGSAEKTVQSFQHAGRRI